MTTSTPYCTRTPVQTYLFWTSYRYNGSYNIESNKGSEFEPVRTHLSCRYMCPAVLFTTGVGHFVSLPGGKCINVFDPWKDGNDNSFSGSKGFDNKMIDVSDGGYDLGETR